MTSQPKLSTWKSKHYQGFSEKLSTVLSCAACTILSRVFRETINSVIMCCMHRIIKGFQRNYQYCYHLLHAPYYQGFSDKLSIESWKVWRNLDPWNEFNMEFGSISNDLFLCFYSAFSWDHSDLLAFFEKIIDVETLR